MEILIDFDGTIVKQVTPPNTKPTKAIGDVNWDVVKKMRLLKAQGYIIYIFTGRIDLSLELLAIHQATLICKFLNKHDIPFDDLYPKPWRVSVIVDDIAVKPEDWIKE